MGNSSYRATVASIRTVYGRRLRKQNYQELMAMHSVLEVAAYLKETPAYHDALCDLEPAFTHRGYLESVLNRTVFTQYLHFCRLEQLLRTPFFRFAIMDYEIRELFKAIQLLPQGKDAYISAMSTWLAPYTIFSLDQLARATTIEGIIAAVAHTPYQEILEEHLLHPTDGSSFTSCEIALRSCYLNQILADAKQVMHGENRKALEDLVREQIDFVNLINAYRLKSVFRTEPTLLKDYMLPISGHLPKRVCQQLYEAPDVASFQQLLQTTRYGRLLGVSAQLPDNLQMEKAFQTLRCQTARNALHFSNQAAVSLYAVQFLQQVEVNNLTTIIEGIRYGTSVSYMESLLTFES